MVNFQSRLKFYKNKISLVLFLLLFYSYSIKAEDNLFLNLKDSTIIINDTTNYLFPRNSIYLELLGTSIVYSINYERSVYSFNNNNFSLKIGGSYFIYGMGNARTFIIGVNYKSFINKKLLFGLGTNVVFWNEVDYSMSSTNYDNYTYYNADISLMYIPQKSFFVKPSFILFFNNDYFIHKVQAYFGISIGFKFGKQ